MTSSRRRVAIAITSIAVVVALGAFVFLPPPNEKPDLDAGLTSASAAVGVGGRVHLADVATFDWDRVYLFGPYVPVG